MTKRKMQLHFWAALVTSCAVFAIGLYIASNSILTDLPHEMVLAKTNGTLEAIDIKYEARRYKDRYHARLTMADGGGSVRRFGTFGINDIPNGLAKFRSLQPGDQLEVIYRADRRGTPLPSKKSARIMAIRANGQPILSLAESTALSISLRKERREFSLFCAIIAVCALIRLLFLYKNRK